MCGIFFLRSGFFFGARSSSTPSQSSRKNKSIMNDRGRGLLKQFLKSDAIFRTISWLSIWEIAAVFRAAAGEGKRARRNNSNNNAFRKKSDEKNPLPISLPPFASSRSSVQHMNNSVQRKWLQPPLSLYRRGRGGRPSLTGNRGRAEQ